MKATLPHGVVLEGTPDEVVAAIELLKSEVKYKRERDLAEVLRLMREQEKTEKKPTASAAMQAVNDEMLKCELVWTGVPYAEWFIIEHC